MDASVRNNHVQNKWVYQEHMPYFNAHTFRKWTQFYFSNFLNFSAQIKKI